MPHKACESRSIISRSTLALVLALSKRGTLHTARGKALPKHASILGVCSISSTNQCFMFFVSGSPDSARVQHFYEVRQKRTPVRILFRLVIISNVYDVHD